jgi:hypothetical protein
MKTLILKDKVISYSHDLKGSTALSRELVNLMEENGELHEKRTSLLYGIGNHKKEVSCEVFDEYALASSGELLRIRAHYHLSPAPTKTLNFDITSGNVMYLVRLLRKNCELLKEKLDSMRTIVDELQNNNMYISDVVHDMYLNCEKLYTSIQFDIGFITNIVVLS